MGKYWERRKNSLYYQAVFRAVSVVGRDARSILDVGSANAEYIQWFRWIEKKVRLDVSSRPPLEGVTDVTTDFFEWEPVAPFDLTLCLQVLEHIPDAGAFCNQLKQTSPRLLISVPYRWRAGRLKGHVHDPVDEEKLASWMGIRPNHSMIIPEVFGAARLIAYYDLANGPKARIAREERDEAIAEKIHYLSGIT